MNGKRPKNPGHHLVLYIPSMLKKAVRLLLAIISKGSGMGMVKKQRVDVEGDKIVKFLECRLIRHVHVSPEAHINVAYKNTA